jgi:type VI secretion system secreted protein VgrG
MVSITLKVGQNSIKIDPPGVTIVGSVMVDMQAPMTKITGDGMLVCKGGMIMSN